MPTFTYGLYPFSWVSEGASGYHAPPVGSACVLDLRNDAQQATQGQSSGYGLFAWESSPPSDLVQLGTGYAPTLQIDNAARTELRTKLGLSADPTGATLADAMASVLGDLADPTGASGPRPIMPGRSGLLELHLAGHSRIWSQQIAGDEVLSMSPKGRANRIREVIRAKLTAAEAAGGKRLLQKVLAAELLKLGLTRDEIAEGAPGKAAQWRRLLSASLRAKHGDARPEKPTTSFSETWPNVVADIEAGGTDLTWTTLLTDTIKTVSGNRAEPSSGFAFRWGVASAAVSSDDHVTSAIAKGASGWAGVVARASAAPTVTGYVSAFLNDGRQTWKYVAGTRTQIGTPSGTGNLVLLSCDVNGSTVTHKTAGQSDSSVTDTSIASGLRGGIWLYADGSTSFAQIGAWSIDDGLVPAPVAAFSATPLSGRAPLSVAFADSSTGSPTSWLWERNGGAGWSTFATSQNPTAEFTPGTWSIRLTATNAGGSDAEEKAGYLVVTPSGGVRCAGWYGCGTWGGLGIGRTRR